MAHMRGGIRTAGRAQTRQHPQEVERNQEQAEKAHGNVGETERLISGLLGGGLLLRSVMRPVSAVSGIGALIGIALVHRSLTGYCRAYDLMGVNTRDQTDASSLGRRNVQ